MSGANAKARKNGGPSRKSGGASASVSEDRALAELKKLYGFMTEQGLERLEFGRGGYQVRLVRRRAASAGSSAAAFAAALASAAPSSAVSAPAAAAPARPSLPAGASALKSPMMGIFYRSATPSSPPYVKEGQAVKAGQVLCLIEAMKVFNEVKAESDGKLLQALVDNGKPVQAGQDLFVFEKR